MTTVRHEILSRLGELSERLPELRFGQMICNLSDVASGAKPDAQWDLEDEELLDAINQLLTGVGDRGPATLSAEHGSLR